jgi:hypothetical protein
MKTIKEMQEALDAGYILHDTKYPNCTIIQIDGFNILSDYDKIDMCNIGILNPENWEIQRPDLTKPQIVHLDHKGWSWDDDPEKAEERYLLSIRKDGYFNCWHDGKTSENFGFNTKHSLIWSNFSWEKPATKKKQITLTLTDEQIEEVEEFLRGRK